MTSIFIIIYNYRIWNLTKEANMDHHHRSMAKAVSYRIWGTLATAIIAFIATRRWELSLGIATADLVVKTALYYFHERAWNHIHWGRK